MTTSKPSKREDGEIIELARAINTLERIHKDAERDHDGGAYLSSDDVKAFGAALTVLLSTL